MHIRTIISVVFATVAAGMVGCTNTRTGSAILPPGAQLVAESAGGAGVFEASSEGMVYIVDHHPTQKRADMLLYTGPIEAGQIVTVDLTNDRDMESRATIDGKPIGLKLPSGDVWYRVYFLERSLRRRTAGES